MTWKAFEGHSILSDLNLDMASSWSPSILIQLQKGSKNGDLQTQCQKYICHQGERNSSVTKFTVSLSQDKTIKSQSLTSYYAAHDTINFTLWKWSSNQHLLLGLGPYIN